MLEAMKGPFAQFLRSVPGQVAQQVGWHDAAHRAADTARPSSERKMASHGLVSALQNSSQRRQATRVARRGADGNANPLRQLITVHRPDDDAELLQFIADAPTVSDVHEDE